MLNLQLPLMSLFDDEMATKFFRDNDSQVTKLVIYKQIFL